MSSGVTWEGEDRCRVGDVVFQVLPLHLFDWKLKMSMEGADFFLFKVRPLIERYAELLAELRPRTIFELGIFGGGSTAFFHELARPDRLVAIDERPAHGPELRD